jgi:ferredoxin-NADP reductase
MTEARTTLREQEGDLVVESAQLVADDVVALTLVDPDGAALPPWTPGAHVDLMLTPDLVRQYSLCGNPADDRSIRVAVLRDPDSRGGSVFIHEKLTPGAQVRVRGPRNHFALVEAPRYIFIAGGIGITPLLPMLAEVEAAGADWRLYYAGHQRAAMAFLDELAGYGDKVALAPRDETDRFDLAALLGSPDDATLVYCCGPERLLEAVEAACAGWPAGALHLERFAAKSADVPAEGEHEFEVVLASTGITVTVPVDRSVFDVVQEAGVNILGSCHEGICGTCESMVLEGEVDHRDSILSESERASNETMMICVSRCKSARLTLDL